MNYTGLCLSSGGIRGLILLGALSKYFKENLLSNVKYYSGSSVGSIIVTLLAIGYNPIEILSMSCSDDLSSKLSVFNIANIGTIQGVYHTDILKNFIEEKIIIKLGYSPTFKQLHNQSDQYIVIPVYCLSETKGNRKMYCSPDDTPDMKIIDAITMSCNIPLIFQKLIYENKVYIDGVFTSHFPIEALKERLEFNESCDDYKILGLYLEHQEFNNDNILEYISNILNIPIHDQNDINMYDKNTDIIRLAIPDGSAKISCSNFNLSTIEKCNLFNDGYFQVLNKSIKVD